jgi:hypothetical protein
MGQLSANPGDEGLTPEPAGKLRRVEREFERIEKSAGERAKWLWLGLVPRLIQIGCILSACFVMLSIVVEASQRTPWSVVKPTTDGWMVAVRCTGRLISSLTLLLVATWASRYCKARSEGRISTRVL